MCWHLNTVSNRNWRHAWYMKWHTGCGALPSSQTHKLKLHYFYTETSEVLGRTWSPYLRTEGVIEQRAAWLRPSHTSWTDDSWVLNNGGMMINRIQRKNSERHLLQCHFLLLTLQSFMVLCLLHNPQRFFPVPLYPLQILFEVTTDWTRVPATRSKRLVVLVYWPKIRFCILRNSKCRHLLFVMALRLTFAMRRCLLNDHFLL